MLLDRRKRTNWNRDYRLIEKYFTKYWIGLHHVAALVAEVDSFFLNPTTASVVAETVWFRTQADQWAPGGEYSSLGKSCSALAYCRWAPLLYASSIKPLV